MTARRREAERVIRALRACGYLVTRRSSFVRRAAGYHGPIQRAAALAELAVIERFAR